MEIYPRSRSGDEEERTRGCELGHELEHDWFSFWDFVIASLRARVKRRHHLLFRGFARSSGNEVERHAEASRFHPIKHDFI